MKILATEGISKNAEIALQKAGFEVISAEIEQNQLENYIINNSIDAILVGNNTQIQQELIDACYNLKLIGYKNNTDNIDVQYAKDQGLHVINTSDASANSVAELVFAHLLGLARNLHQSNREMPLEGDFNFKGLKESFTGNELRGKTIGIIGINTEAIATAKIALGLGMNVIFSNDELKSITISIEFFDGQGVEFSFNTISLNELLSKSNFISLHIKQQDDYIIGVNEFERMKNGIGIINCSNGKLIDEIALINAIEDGKVKYAGLDVFENEPTPNIQLLMNPNLSLSPNIASSTFEAKEQIDMELANKIIELLNE
ncbi:MAG: 3-phosphoglycerate dehydrogenase [Tenacibaculum sp.]|nr:3-phosphoglycerate dehydrogenase [Tenacibaculum sp.]